MPKLTESDLRFQLKYGLHEISRSILRDLLGSSERRQRGLDMAADVLLQRFARLTVIGPEPDAPPVDKTKPAD